MCFGESRRGRRRLLAPAFNDLISFVYSFLSLLKRASSPGVSKRRVSFQETAAIVSKLSPFGSSAGQ